MNERIVSISFLKKIEYPKAPFDPPLIYPEFKNKKILNRTLNTNNEIYSLIRECFVNLGLDKKNLGTLHWNPLKSLVKEGQNVVIKPNLVMDSHPQGLRGIKATITNASIIRPIIDYILLATNCSVSITICDVPLQSARWDHLIKYSGLSKLVDYYKKHNININLLDLRYEIALLNKEGVYYKKIRKIRDPKGYQSVNLGKKSYLQEIIKDYKKLEITDYGQGTLAKHHNPNKNEYLICKTILDADLFINVPKLKTHKKAGITVSLKNLIGINGDKSWIAHHRKGVDEYEKFILSKYLKYNVNKILKRYAPKTITTLVYTTYRKVLLKGKTIKEHGMEEGDIYQGNWYGNDTIWRTILDINNILFYSNKNGIMKDNRQRKYLSIVDGIIGMEKEGPMEGIPVRSGVVLAGSNPVLVDRVAAELMGFNYKKIPHIREGFCNKFWNLCTPREEETLWVSKINRVKDINLGFKPPKGWVNKIEK